MKPADQLTAEDFAEQRVWEFADDAEAVLPDETYMRPVAELPVTSLAGRVVGTQFVLANGHQIFGVLGCIDLADPVYAEHCFTLTVFHRGERFDMARYYDADYSRRGPVALAAFLGLPAEAVFPLRYDISDVAVGNPECLRRSIPAVPTSRLSEEELIALAVKLSLG